MQWQVTVVRARRGQPGARRLLLHRRHLPRPAATSAGSCNDFPSALAAASAPAKPGGVHRAEHDGTTETTVGEATQDVTYFIVNFTDGQQLKLIPVTAGGHRYIAWIAPLSMTIQPASSPTSAARTPTAGRSRSRSRSTSRASCPCSACGRTARAAPPTDARGHRPRHHGRSRLEGHRVRGPVGHLLRHGPVPAIDCVPAERSSTTAILGRGGPAWTAGWPSARPRRGWRSVRVTLVERQDRHGAAGRRRERGPVRVRGRPRSRADPLDRVRRVRQQTGTGSMASASASGPPEPREPR